MNEINTNICKICGFRFINGEHGTCAKCLIEEKRHEELMEVLHSQDEKLQIIWQKLGIVEGN